MNTPVLSHTRCIAVAAIVLAVTTLSFAAPAANALFKSKQGYTMLRPTGLRQVPNTDPVMDVFFLNDTGASFNVTVEPAPPGSTLEYARKSVSHMATNDRHLAKFKVLRQGTVMLGGSKAIILDTSCAAGKPLRPLRLATILTVRNGKAYTFAYGGPTAVYPRYELAFKKSLASVHWTKQ